MVDINDRRQWSGDFNNPKGTFSLTSHGYAEEDAWSSKPWHEARKDVHEYYRAQKDTKTWQEATKVAKRRTDSQYRRAPLAQNLHGAHYAEDYQENLVRVMATKGPELATRHGELSNPRHPQSGYGRT